VIAVSGGALVFLAKHRPDVINDFVFGLILFFLSTPYRCVYLDATLLPLPCAAATIISRPFSGGKTLGHFLPTTPAYPARFSVSRIGFQRSV
jgi:hypothetical protein